MPAMKDVEVANEEPEVYFEDLAALEQEFDDAELEIVRKQWELNAPLYARREAIIAKIPHFWALVLEQAPPELDQFIQPSDSQLFADALKSISVDRFEINEPNGSPRSFSIKFEFEAGNDFFEDTVLEKKFWYRKAKNGWAGLVSEPVPIQWKKGKDLTKGLTAGAVKLWEAKQKNPEKKAQELPEYKTLVSKIDSDSDSALSFFAWFTFVSGRTWVSAEESAEAEAEEKVRREKRKAGEKVEPEQDDEDIAEYDETLEIHPGGEDAAIFIADDLFPNAIKYFTSGAEMDAEELSEMDEDFEDEDSDEELDIRALVGKGKKGDSASPPAKKQRT